MNPRDPNKPSSEQGFFEKYAVRRIDGKSEPGEKHENCSYYVLDLDHDPHATAALRAYAESCRSTHPLLARDLYSRIYQEMPNVSAIDAYMVAKSLVETIKVNADSPPPLINESDLLRSACAMIELLLQHVQPLPSIATQEYRFSNDGIAKDLEKMSDARVQRQHQSDIGRVTPENQGDVGF